MVVTLFHRLLILCRIRAYGAVLIVSPPGTKEGEPQHYMQVARTMKEENEGKL